MTANIMTQITHQHHFILRLIFYDTPTYDTPFTRFLFFHIHIYIYIYKFFDTPLYKRELVYRQPHAFRCIIEKTLRAGVL